MRKVILALVFTMVGSTLFAQSLRPILVVKVRGEKAAKSEPLSLSAVKADVRILGYLAETKMTLTFHNPHNRALAGDLYFPLPEGATVSGYALDINGVMVDGAVVPRRKARQVYESIVRMGIDPGLVEWVKGNNFKTRVFPIPARGSRTIMVKYVGELVHNKAGTMYRLPLAFNKKVKQFDIRIEVVKSVDKPTVTQGALPNFQFARWRESFVAETSLKNAELNRDLTVAIPRVDRKRVLVERSADGTVYFCINDFPKDPRPRGAARFVVPRRIVILWDASGSRGRTDHRREIALLRSYFGQAGFRNARTQADLVLFRNVAAAPERFVIQGGDIGRLAARLARVRYDGGTQMGSISAAAGAAPPDFYLLFSDGISNFGRERPDGLRAPVYAFSADATTNHSFLRYVAMRTGGAYFNLNRMTNDMAVPHIGRSPYVFIGVSARGAEIGETCPGTSQPVHGRFTLAGKLLAKEARLTLNYGVGGRILRRAEYRITSADATQGDMLRRFWAQKKVQDLQVFPKRNEERITKLGTRHNIVTPGTSLIVLDNLRQYVQHRIRPPKSLGDMRRKYEDIVEKQGQREEANQKRKLDRIVSLWKQRVRWWETGFKYPRDFKYTGSSEGRRLDDRAPSAGRPAGTAEGSDRPAPASKDAGKMLGVRAAERAEGEQGAALRNGRGLGRKGGLGGAPGGRTGAAEPGVAIKAWDPKTPYLTALRAAAREKVLDVYMEQRKTYSNSPAFFLDCADFLRKQQSSDLALQVLSNVAEMELENPALLRILAHRLKQLGRLDLSAMLFEQVLRLRPEEPQSYRDLALVLARQGKYRRAIDLLYQVVTGKWDRFAEIEVIALMELNALIPRARAAGVRNISVDPRLIRLLDVDVRVVLTWDADLTDMDLWVTEPSREKAYYGHRRTRIGGHMSRDFTRGYGPEEYILRKAMRGSYKVQANYFGSSAPRLVGSVTLQADIFTNYGRPNEKCRSLTFRLTRRRQVVTIGDMEF